MRIHPITVQPRAFPGARDKGRLNCGEALQTQMQCACLHPDTPLLMSALHHSKLTPTHLHSFKPQLKSYLLKEPFPDPSSKLLSPLYILSFPSMDLMQFVHRHYSCVYLMSICFRPSTTNSMTAGNGLTKAHCHKHHDQQSTWHITGT